MTLEHRHPHPLMSFRERRAPVTADDVRRFRDGLLADSVVVAKADAGARELSPVAIGPEEGEALLAWVRKERAHRTLESGLGFAMSTPYICEGLLANGGDGLHRRRRPLSVRQSADALHHVRGVGLQVLEEAGVHDVVEFYAEESQIILQRLLAEGRQFDLAFIDGNHRFEGVFLDLIYAGQLLREGSVIFVDDVQIPGPKHAVQFSVANLGWVIEDEGREGVHEWAVVRTSSNDAFLRPYTEFVDF